MVVNISNVILRCFQIREAQRNDYSLACYRVGVLNKSYTKRRDRKLISKLESEKLLVPGAVVRASTAILTRMGHRLLKSNIDRKLRDTKSTHPSGAQHAVLFK